MHTLSPLYLSLAAAACLSVPADPGKQENESIYGRQGSAVCNGETQFPRDASLRPRSRNRSFRTVTQLRPARRNLRVGRMKPELLFISVDGSPWGCSRRERGCCSQRDPERRKMSFWGCLHKLKCRLRLSNRTGKLRVFPRERCGTVLEKMETFSSSEGRGIAPNAFFTRYI